MIPLYKLEKLPRIQKLRKIAKIFTFADNRLCMASEKSVNIFSQDEIVFFSEAADILAKDDQFTKEARKTFAESSLIFTSAISANNEDVTSLRRALNSVKHILLSETGREQADWDFTCNDGKLDAQKRQIFDGMQVYMEDIRSPFNVGAMFRTAESFGVEKIILSPFCADPRHRRAERTAMGCTNIIPWERQDLFPAEREPQQIAAENDCSLQGKLRLQGIPSIPVFALETGGIPLADFTFPRSGILIAGSEELGVSPRALEAADASLGRVTIPCYGTKASLNVSAAFGIAMQAWAASIQK